MACNECDPCTGCSVELDFSCIKYNINNSSISELDGLNLPNTTTLKTYAELVDEKLKQLNVLDFSLPYLRVSYVINTMQQFAQSVDTEFNDLAADVATALSNSNVSLVATDSNSIDFTTSGTLNHTMTASVKISAQANNLVSILSDGIYSSPQTLSINYSTKELTITNGNTVDLTSLVCGVSGFLGNVTANPTAVDGQYWYRTDSGKLYMKLNGSVREITIV